MSLRFDITGILSPSGEKLIACLRLPSGLTTALGATITDATVGVHTLDTGSTEIYLGLSAGAYDYREGYSVISALPDTTDRPYTVEIREVAGGYDWSVYSDLAAAFSADSLDVAAAQQVADGSMKGGWIVSGAWSLGEAAVSNGSGARTIQVEVLDDLDNVVQSASVRVAGGGIAWGPVLTDASGIATFSLDDGSWTVYVSKAGYDSSTSTNTVSANATLTKNISTVAVGSPTPDTLTAYTNVVDQAGEPVSGAVLQVALKAGTGTAGQAYTRVITNYTANSNGLVTMVLLKSSTYNARLQQSTGVFGEWVTFDSGDTSPLALPEVVGKQVA